MQLLYPCQHLASLDIHILDTISVALIEPCYMIKLYSWLWPNQPSTGIGTLIVAQRSFHMPKSSSTLLPIKAQVYAKIHVQDCEALMFHLLQYLSQTPQIAGKGEDRARGLTRSELGGLAAWLRGGVGLWPSSASRAVGWGETAASSASLRGDVGRAQKAPPAVDGFPGAVGPLGKLGCASPSASAFRTTPVGENLSSRFGDAGCDCAWRVGWPMTSA